MPLPRGIATGGGGSGGLSSNIGKGALVVSSADLTLTADNSLRLIPWDTELLDDAAFHSVASNTDQLVIPSGYGGTGTLFQVRAHIDVTTITNVMDIFMVTGAATRLSEVRVPFPNAQGGFEISWFAVAPADATTFSIGYTKASANATMNHTYDTANYASWFAITKLK